MAPSARSPGRRDGHGQSGDRYGDLADCLVSHMPQLPGEQLYGVHRRLGVSRVQEVHRVSDEPVTYRGLRQPVDAGV